MGRDIRHKLSKRIRQLRCERGLTQEELSDRAGIDYKHIQRLEGQDPCDVRLSTLEKLAKGLKVNLSELVDL